MRQGNGTRTNGTKQDERDETGRTGRNGTKQDETRHFRAPALSAPQAAAVELVALGKNDTDAAKAAGVTRQTVNGWRNHDPAFVAAVNARRHELWQETHDRLRGMATRALTVLERALDAPPLLALPAAIHVLKCLKVYGEVDAPQGPTTAEGVLARRAEAEARRELAGRVTAGSIEALTAETFEVPRLAQAHFDRLKEEWGAARQEAPGSTKEEEVR